MRDDEVLVRDNIGLPGGWRMAHLLAGDGVGPAILEVALTEAQRQTKSAEQPMDIKEDFKDSKLKLAPMVRVKDEDTGRLVFRAAVKKEVKTEDIKPEVKREIKNEESDL